MLTTVMKLNAYAGLNLIVIQKTQRSYNGPHTMLWRDGVMMAMIQADHEADFHITARELGIPEFDKGGGNMKFKRAVNIFLQFFKRRTDCNNYIPKTDAVINVQGVFNKVIDAGYFKRTSSIVHPFMCRELCKAVHDGAISVEECTAAGKEINQYLGGYRTLWLKLRHIGLPYAYADRLSIYRDWEGRP